MVKAEQKKHDVTPIVSLPMRATVCMSAYPRKTGELVDYVAVKMTNPFDDPDFGEVEIAPKWRNVKGTFEYMAKKTLKTQESFEIAGEIKASSYFNRNKKRNVTYPAIWVRDPFDPERQIEFCVRGDENAAVFSMLASRAFKVQLEDESVPTASE